MENQVKLQRFVAIFCGIVLLIVLRPKGLQDLGVSSPTGITLLIGLGLCFISFFAENVSNTLSANEEGQRSFYSSIGYMAILLAPITFVIKVTFDQAGAYVRRFSVTDYISIPPLIDADPETLLIVGVIFSLILLCTIYSATNSAILAIVIGLFGFIVIYQQNPHSGRIAIDHVWKSITTKSSTVSVNGHNHKRIDHSHEKENYANIPFKGYTKRYYYSSGTEGVYVWLKEKNYNQVLALDEKRIEFDNEIRSLSLRNNFRDKRRKKSLEKDLEKAGNSIYKILRNKGKVEKK